MSFNFAILVAGFRSRSSGHDDLYSNVITLPTLHVFGDTDKVIEKSAYKILQLFTTLCNLFCFTDIRVRVYKNSFPI